MSSIEIGSLHLVHSSRSRHSFDIIYLSNLIFLLIFSTYILSDTVIF